MANALGAYSTLLKRGDGGNPETFTAIAEVNSISGPSFALDTTEVTHMESPGAWKEFIPTLLDAGELSFEINFIPTDSTHSYAAGLLSDMVNRTLRNFQLVFPDTGNTTWTFSAYVTGFDLDASVDGKLGASVTLRITGQPTLA